MDFLLEPMDLGSELDKLLDSQGASSVACDTGLVCSKGIHQPKALPGEDSAA